VKEIQEEGGQEIRIRRDKGKEERGQEIEIQNKLFPFEFQWAFYTTCIFIFITSSPG
jgi:hypothetical protein